MPARRRRLGPSVLAAIVVGLTAPIVLAWAAGPESGETRRESSSSDAFPAVRGHSASPRVLLVGPAPRRQQPAVGHLTLRNSSRGDVRVEVRTGTGPSCEALKPGPVHVLPPGKRWLIVGSRTVCWRRAASLAFPVTAWAPWQRQVLTAGVRLEVTL